ncbi:MAG: hypothetical protein ABEJ43_02220 [Haloferacaceae archaeon]
MVSAARGDGRGPAARRIREAFVTVSGERLVAGADTGSLRETADAVAGRVDPGAPRAESEQNRTENRPAEAVDEDGR